MPDSARRFHTFFSKRTLLETVDLFLSTGMMIMSMAGKAMRRTMPS
jgi:hypothetical protein